MNGIDITGCDLVALVKKAYELSKPQGMGHLQFREGPLTDEQAKFLIRETTRYPIDLDYVAGRAVKLTARYNDEGKLMIPASWYDHTDDELSQLLQAVGVTR